MRANISPINPKGSQQKAKAQKAKNTQGTDFARNLKKAAKEIYAKVPETLAAYKEDFKKRKLSEERNWKIKDDEEGNDTVDSLIAKIEKRLKRLAQLTEDEKKK
ncbi:hypothetical protein ACFL5G_03670 [Candidatus Margulisiibacteriota bacterium]